MAGVYATLENQYKFKNPTVFSARFDKQEEDNQVLDDTEIFINLNNNHKLPETDNDNIDIESLLEHRIQNQEMKSSGWNFDKIISMTILFYKTGELHGSSFVKVPLKIENNEKSCFLWLILAKLHHCNSSHPNRVSNFRQNLDE